MQATRDRLVHRYTPRGACKKLFECRDYEVLLIGPAGTGKSRGCLEKLHLQAMKHPGMRGLIVRKTLASLGSTTLVTWRSYVIKQALLTGEVEFYGGSQEEPPQYRYRNGSVIVIGGMDKPTKIMSSEYDVAYVGEGECGCTADGTFHNLLSQDFTLSDKIDIPRWEGVHDRLYIYERNL